MNRLIPSLKYILKLLLISCDFIPVSYCICKNGGYLSFDKVTQVYFNPNINTEKVIKADIWQNMQRHYRIQFIENTFD